MDRKGEENLLKPRLQKYILKPMQNPAKRIKLQL
jgi:hypothetical protein